VRERLRYQIANAVACMPNGGALCDLLGAPNGVALSQAKPRADMISAAIGVGARGNTRPARVQVGQWEA
jgi:hypothetical protein